MVYAVPRLAGTVSLSPDGTTIAALISTPERATIVAVPTAGGEARELARLPGTNFDVAIDWTPDGRYLLHTRQRPDAPFELWRVAVASGEAVRFSPFTPGLTGAVRVHPDGRRIGFTAGETDTEVWVLESGTRPGRAGLKQRFDALSGRVCARNGACSPSPWCWYRHAAGTTAVWRAPAPLGLDAFLPLAERGSIPVREVELGRRLFFDPRLSADHTITCATCHQPQRAFTDDERFSTGVAGRRGQRNAPTLVNRGYGSAFFWDGRAATLEEQVLQPIQDTLEMSLPLRELTGRLARDRATRRAFERAFSDGVTTDNVARALASFVRTLRFGDTPVDRYRAGDRTALAASARRGLDLFAGKANCTSCHAGPNLTDEAFHNSGTAVASGDPGRAAITGRDVDTGAFKTPTLRELIHTAPYMHDGSLATLEEVIEHYDRGGVANPQLDPEIRPLLLTPAEKRDLLAFLRAFGSATPFCDGPAVACGQSTTK